MDILNTINVTTRAADTLYQIATFNWNKKSIIRLAVATATLVGAATVINIIETHGKGVDLDKGK